MATIIILLLIVILFEMFGQRAENAQAGAASDSSQTITSSPAKSENSSTSTRSTRSAVIDSSTGLWKMSEGSMKELQKDYPYMVIPTDGDHYFTNPHGYFGGLKILIEYASDQNPDPKVNSTYTYFEVLKMDGTSIQTYPITRSMLEPTRDITVLYGQKNMKVKIVHVNTAIPITEMLTNPYGYQFGLNNESVYLYHGNDGKIKMAVPTPLTFTNARYQEITEMDN